MRRAGLDYWEHLNLEVVDSWPDFLIQQRKDSCWFFTKTAKRIYTEVAYTDYDYLVFGSETNGLPPSILGSNESRCLRIPQSTHVRSLNLSNAVAVAAYEARRQFGTQ